MTHAASVNSMQVVAGLVCRRNNDAKAIPSQTPPALGCGFLTPGSWMPEACDSLLLHKYIQPLRNFCHSVLAW